MAVQWVTSQHLPKKFHFYQYAALEHDGAVTMYPPDDPTWVSYTISANEYDTAARAITAPGRRLSSIMRELGHSHIDILKMDIEGAEYSVISNLIESGIEVSQLLVEFHHRFKDIGIEKTQNAIKLLNKYGYKIFDISSRGEELSFLRTTRSFFRLWGTC